MNDPIDNIDLRNRTGSDTKLTNAQPSLYNSLPVLRDESVARSLIPNHRSRERYSEQE